MTREVDVAILGAGSAGLFALSMVKRKTDEYVLINGGELGTTCARVGCMPSKVMIQVAEDFHRKSIYDRVGIDGAEELSLDVEAAMEHVQDLRDVFVDRTLGVTGALDEDHLIEGFARFIDKHTVEVNGEQIRAKVFVIATGSTPIIPEAWQGCAEDIITTDDIFELESLPESMAVIGLGAIGLELGQALKRMGVEVTAIDMLDRVAQLVDTDVNDMAVSVIGKEMPLLLGVEAGLKKTDAGIEVTAGDRTVVVEKVLASLGRSPNLDGLNLAVTGIPLDDRGVPEYDPFTMQIGQADNMLPVFIAGDVTTERAILHEAGHEGRAAGYNAMQMVAGEPVVRFRRKVPLAITFCDPNIATVGKQLGELDADAIAVGEIQFAPVGRALIIGKNRGLLRLYVQKSDGLLLGASMCCVKGEHLAHLVCWSIEQGLTVFDMLKMPFYHPVIEEALQAALYNVLPDLDVKHELVELQQI